MTRLALLIGWKDCLVRFQSRTTVVFIIVLPLAMTIVTGLAFKGLEPQNLQATVAIVEADPSDFWKETPPGLKVRRDLTGDEARKAVEEKEIQGAIILGPRNPHSISAKLIIHPNQTPEKAIVEGAFAQLVETLRQGPKPDVDVTAQREEVGRQDTMANFSSFSQAVSGNGVMFILLNCITAAGITIVRERRRNTLTRLLIAPISRTTLLLGKTLGVFYVGVAQALVVFGFGAVIGVFGKTATQIATNIVGVTAVTLLLILVACAMGLTVSALCRREETAESLGVPIAIVLTAMGGGMFPVERSPAWMQFVAKLLPTGWAMDAYHNLLGKGEGLPSIGLHLLVLAGFAAAFFAFGVRRLEWE